MGLLDDVLNGGLDRDLDGDIDNRDRDLYIEECVINEEKEKQSEDFEYDYPVITYGSSVQSEKERIIRGRPAYSGFKGKDEKLIVEWEKMTKDNADKAKKWFVFYLIGFGIVFLGVLLMIVLPFALYSELDSISPFVISGLIILLVGVCVAGIGSAQYTELTRYYTHVIDKNGFVVYRSQCCIDKLLKELEEKEKKYERKNNM